MGDFCGGRETTPRDYSRPFLFDLNHRKPNKTLDIGLNGTTVSSDPYGGVLQLSAYHAVHGMILAAPYEQFDKTRYYEPTYVRKYRAKMLEMLAKGESGFGLRVGDACGLVGVSHESVNAAVVTYTTKQGAEIECHLTVESDGSFSQDVIVKNNTGRSVDLSYSLNLELSVHRASYGQLTEGGPVPLPDCENHLSISEDQTSFTVQNPKLDANLTGRLEVQGSPATLDGLRKDMSTGVLSGASTAVKIVAIETGSSTRLKAIFKLSPGTDASSSVSKSDRSITTQEANGDWNAPSSARSYIIRRNMDYILGNCCLPISDDVVGIITDHVALPLGWNRDNYWQWRLLLKTRKHLDTLVAPNQRQNYHHTISRTLKGHLRWVFQTAERPHGFWHRSYIITGKPKDGPTFQLDQQCYPFLELSDYYEEFPEDADFVKEIMQEPSVAEVLSLITSKQDPETKLFPTDETPGDDEVEHPYHFSSHVLLWYTLCRMAKVFRDLGPPSGQDADKIQSLANEVRDTALQHFIQKDEASGESRIAYLVDGYGEKTFYHDANDIPTIFAEEWKFLTTDIQLTAWKNTLFFALSTENKLGYATGGPFGGLGSVHSKGPWPLGYFQELFYGYKTGDSSAQKDAARRIVGAMQWDGTFGEAVDADTGVTTSKAWFAWPGSVLGVLLLDEGVEF